jgi:hypothetical protein
MQSSRKAETISKKLRSKRLKIFSDLSGKSEIDSPTRNLQIKGLPSTASITSLESEFLKFGEINILDTQQISKGEVIVSYFDIREAVLSSVFFSQSYETEYLPDPPFKEFSDILFFTLSQGPKDFRKFSDIFSVVFNENDEFCIRFFDLRKCWSTLKQLEIQQNEVKLKSCLKNSGILMENKENLRPCARRSENMMKFVIDYESFWVKNDFRTTLMIKNIPNKYTQQMLLESINKNHANCFDFLYLPIDFKNRCNVGYAFINFVDYRHIHLFYKEFDGKKWEKFNSEKVCALSYARIQGRLNLEKHFQSSNIMVQEFSMRPLMLLNSNY